MTQPDIWYVTFGPDKSVKTDDPASGSVRSTRTFKSEVDAKLFAMQILSKGWTASAGTLNPLPVRGLLRGIVNMHFSNTLIGAVSASNQDEISGHRF
jgi:hypothetical protein